jgi:hypothetical protein
MPEVDATSSKNYIEREKSLTQNARQRNKREIKSIKTKKESEA